MINPNRKQQGKNELTGKHSFQWSFTATIDVSDVWVQDGYELTEERLQEMLENALLSDLSYAREDEAKVIKVSITESPDQDSVRAAMGYED